MVDQNIIKLDSIDIYNKLYGFPTLNPLVTVIDLNKATTIPNHFKINYGVYALFLKNDVSCTLKYGRQYYDYQEGTIVSFAPGQLVEVEMVEEAISHDVYGLLFHPDLIHGTELGRKISQYSFFEYSQNEALHLSEQERNMIIDCFRKIEYELNYPIDKHSKKLLSDQIQLVLDYCLRFYDRQFYTRTKVNSDILSKFEHYMNEYFNTQDVIIKELPSVKYFADKICLSPNYFGDLIKKETGRTAQEHIHNKIIDLSKSHLSDNTKNISEIAYSLGFQYPQHFSRFFKSSVGITPGEYRANKNIIK